MKSSRMPPCEGGAARHSECGILSSCAAVEDRQCNLYIELRGTEYDVHPRIQEIVELFVEAVTPALVEKINGEFARARGLDPDIGFNQQPEMAILIIYGNPCRLGP